MAPFIINQFSYNIKRRLLFLMLFRQPVADHTDLLQTHTVVQLFYRVVLDHSLVLKQLGVGISGIDLSYGCVSVAVDEKAGKFSEVVRRSGLESIAAEADDSCRWQLGRQSVMQRNHSSLTHPTHVNPLLRRQFALRLSLLPILNFLLEVLLDGAVRVLDVLEAEHLFLGQRKSFERSYIVPREIILLIDGGEPQRRLQQFHPASSVHR